MALSRVRMRSQAFTQENEIEIARNAKRRKIPTIDCNGPLASDFLLRDRRRSSITGAGTLSVHTGWLLYAGGPDYFQNLPRSHILVYPFVIGPIYQDDHLAELQQAEDNEEVINGIRTAICEGSYWMRDTEGNSSVITPYNIFNLSYHFHYRPSPLTDKITGVLPLQEALFKSLWNTFFSGIHLLVWLQQKQRNDVITILYEYTTPDLGEHLLESDVCKYCGIRRKYFDMAGIPWSRSRFHCSFNKEWCSGSFCSCSCYLHYERQNGYPDGENSCGLSHDEWQDDWEIQHVVCEREVPRLYCTDINDYIYDYIDCSCIYRLPRLALKRKNSLVWDPDQK